MESRIPNQREQGDGNCNQRGQLQQSPNADAARGLPASNPEFGGGAAQGADGGPAQLDALLFAGAVAHGEQDAGETVRQPGAGEHEGDQAEQSGEPGHCRILVRFAVSGGVAGGAGGWN